MQNPVFISLLAIAASNPDGFTVKFDDLQPVADGFAVAVSETQNSHGREGLERVIEYVKNNAPKVSAFGGWMDKKTGLFYWDAVIICKTAEEAERVARENKQIAFFNLNDCEEIRL